MKHVKSERLKKLEGELQDLEQWLKLGLVPKKDITKHKEEIEQLKTKIDEEKERLRFLKESGDIEEYVAPKKAQGRSLSDMPTIPDIDLSESMHGGDSGFESEGSNFGNETTLNDKDEDDAEVAKEEEDEEDEEEEDEESYFSDRNRWRRGGIVDPDADEW
jgi:hypothetical protein